ncbi:hypothetical protein BURK1_02866 [Burkholderiales bacterium]|nr:hypothetical protein BURK1_02866 [Burkholderiales bacterium]
MHIVIMAWLFVVGTMALTFGSAVGGIAFFAVAGAAPAAFYAWIKLRRLQAMRAAQSQEAAAASVLEQRVDQRDHTDAGRDQQ